MKILIFDSGTLITLSMNCMLGILHKLKEDFDGKFVIPEEVKEEIVDRPMNIPKYKLGAMRLKVLIDRGVLEFPDSLGVDKARIKKRSKEILNSANAFLYADGKSVHLIDDGEAAVIALSNLLDEKGIENVVAMDERTTRVLCEKPENLKKLLENKLHTKVIIKKKNYETKFFGNVRFIRSPELIYVAFKKDFIEDKSKDMLDAMLYGAKYKGAAISSSEIKAIERMV